MLILRKLVSLAVEVHDSVGVVLAVRVHRARKLVVPVRLCVATLLLERAAERVMGVVVRRRELEQRPELRLGLPPALDPEVGDAERLADRRLGRFELFAFSRATVACAAMPSFRWSRPRWKKFVSVSLPPGS